MGKVKKSFAITLATSALLATVPMTTAFAAQIGNPIPVDGGGGGSTSPAAPVITSNSDITSDDYTNYLISGTGTSGDTVNITMMDSTGDQVSATATVGSDSSWSTSVDLENQTMVSGTVVITATETDQNGNVSPASNSVSVTDTYTTTNSGLTQDTINAVDPYITVVNGQYELTDESYVATLISSDQLQAVQQSLAQMNSALASNTSTSQSDVQSDATTFTQTVTDSQADANLTAAGYGAQVQQADQEDQANAVSPDSTTNGVTKVVFHWWGFQLYLSKHVMEEIMGLGVTVAAAALDAIFEGVPTAILIAACSYILLEIVPSVARPVEITVVYPKFVTGWYYQ